MALSMDPLCRHNTTGSDRQMGERLGYVRDARSLMEGTETLCPHTTTSNHRWLPGTHSRLLSVKSGCICRLFIPVCTGSGAGMQNPLVKFQWRFLLNSEGLSSSSNNNNVIGILMLHSITKISMVQVLLNMLHYFHFSEKRQHILHICCLLS